MLSEAAAAAESKHLGPRKRFTLNYRHPEERRERALPPAREP
jgi:hypothetical protein